MAGSCEAVLLLCCARCRYLGAPAPRPSFPSNTCTAAPSSPRGGSRRPPAFLCPTCLVLLADALVAEKGRRRRAREDANCTLRRRRQEPRCDASEGANADLGQRSQCSYEPCVRLPLCYMIDQGLQTTGTQKRAAGRHTDGGVTGPRVAGASSRRFLLFLPRSTPFHADNIPTMLDVKQLEQELQELRERRREVSLQAERVRSLTALISRRRCVCVLQPHSIHYRKRSMRIIEHAISVTDRQGHDVLQGSGRVGGGAVLRALRFAHRVLRTRVLTSPPLPPPQRPAGQAAARWTDRGSLCSRQRRPRRPRRAAAATSVRAAGAERQVAARC